MPENILSRDEALHALGDISLPTLYRMIKRGEIKPLSDGAVLKRRRSLRFSREEINRVLREAKEREANPHLVAS